jgi:hypothetical protein
MSTKQWWNDAHGGKPEILVERYVPVPLHPPQIPPLRSDRPTSYCLSNGTAVIIIVIMMMMMMIAIIIKAISNADKCNIM